MATEDPQAPYDNKDLVKYLRWIEKAYRSDMDAWPTKEQFAAAFPDEDASRIRQRLYIAKLAKGTRDGFIMLTHEGGRLISESEGTGETPPDGIGGTNGARQVDDDL